MHHYRMNELSGWKTLEHSAWDIVDSTESGAKHEAYQQSDDCVAFEESKELCGDTRICCDSYHISAGVAQNA